MAAPRTGTADVAANVRHAARGANETGETSNQKAEVEKFLDCVRAA
jgi:methyl-accepting chemotaxis protein